MNRSRALAAAIIASMGLGFAALLTRAVFEGTVLGSMGQATLSMLIVTGFLFVAAVAVLASQGHVAALASRHCPSCGSLIYATVRSLDRRRLLTCFSCGHESVTA